jgi:probable HAF family extracellular repeat protein
MKNLTSKILVSLFTLLTAVGAGAQNRYQTFPLGGSFGTFGLVTALNDSGQVLGWWGTNGEAFIVVPGSGWTKNIVKTNGGYVPTSKLTMNNAATIVGQVSPSNRTFYKLWGQPAQEFGYSGEPVNAINTAGYIAGINTQDPPKGQTWVYLMNPQGSTTYIKFPHNSGPPWNEDGNFAEVAGLNNLNQIVGRWLDYSTPPWSGFFYDGKKLNTDFNMPGAISTSPTAINDNQEVVGNWIDQNGVQHGFYWNPTAGFSNIDVTGDTAMGLVGINNSSVILGWWQDDNTPMLIHYVTIVNGQPTASIHVPSSPAGGTVGTAINNAGQVAGWYATQDYVYRGFLYTPSK